MTLDTTQELLKAQSERRPESIAILAPGRASLTYGRLYRHVQDTVRYLNDLGIGRNDRVAIVVPNGPEMAVAFLSVASGATSAPLNPAYRAPEFKFYLSDLHAKALLILAGMDSPAIEVAHALGIHVIELTPDTEGPAGLFTLSGSPQSLTAPRGLAGSGDVALVLHTSGTTSRPKIVPLRHANICTSAKNVRAALALTERDRCLNAMPLFHIHGLIGATLSSISAGASIACTPGFDALQFFAWMDECRPTWYTAVPTMHQAVLAQAAVNAGIVAQCPLRLIRSSSSSLPPQVMAALESTFSAPVIESYGMTEASHQMTSNPLPPRPRKAGSVGVPAGPEVSIMDEAGNHLAPETTGEIVIRGANVTQGYENNPEANARAFADGWFRTGDQGYADSDGYFYITGRLKEMINRGGEKVAPREVDEAFLDHPAVVQAVTFAVPHPTLGEDVAVAVILREHATVEERQLREFAFSRLTDFKVPSEVLIVDEIPKGPTGKLQRIGLADKLADALKPAHVAPRNSVEETLARIWSEVLGLDQVSILDNFFAQGGDSISAAQVVSEIRKTFGAEWPLPRIFQLPTIEQMAEAIVQQQRLADRASLVLLRDGGPEPPVFCLPGTLGNVFTDLGDLARHLGPGRPIFGFQDGVHNPSKVEALAARYVKELDPVWPDGPVFLVGICSGGTVAFEMAQQLRAALRHVALLALVEPTPPYSPGLRAYASLARFLLSRIVPRSVHHVRQASRLRPAEQRTYVRLKLKLIANQWTLRRYSPRPYPGRVHLFLTAESLQPPHPPRLGWRDWARGGIDVRQIPGTHETVTGMNDTPVEPAHMQALAEQLRIVIRRVPRKGFVETPDA